MKLIKVAMDWNPIRTRFYNKSGKKADFQLAGKNSNK